MDHQQVGDTLIFLGGFVSGFSVLGCWWLGSAVQMWREARKSDQLLTRIDRDMSLLIKQGLSYSKDKNNVLDIEAARLAARKRKVITIERGAAW